jgi:putative ABC transport system permease protein
MMIENYIKTAFRNLKKHKGYSFLNIAGFAVGMACCLLILIYVRHELSYDQYHKDAERIFRIVQDIRTKTANRIFAPISPMVAPTLKKDFPQVEKAGRIWARGNILIKREDRKFYESLFMYADNEIFDILTIPFIQGNPEQALTRPYTLVVSERMAVKYFGAEDPIGKAIQVNDTDFEVTGVVENAPENTHLKYDLIASMETLGDWDEMSNWFSTMFYTYLKIKPNVEVKYFSNQVSHLADRYVGETLERWGDEFHYLLQPVSSIHLQSHLRYELEPPGNPLYITIFSLVGLFILIIACLNFMNLSTARASNRAKEVGMRKVIGAQKHNLISQFIGESVLVVYLSLALALLIARLSIPALNDVLGTALSFKELMSTPVILALIGGGLLVGLGAGAYPAFLLSSFKPTATLKGMTISVSKSFPLRTILVVLQFTITVVLIIGTILMYRQFDFMKNKYLGFEKEQKLILPLRGGISIKENYETVKDLFSKHPSIKSVSASSSVPGRGVSNFGIKLVGEDDDKNQSMFHLYFDHDFIPDYGIGILAGRAFSRDMSTDIRGAFLINEAALRAFGWSSPEQAVGKRLQTGFGGRVNPIIGVTKDFHYRGLQSEVEPLVMEYMPDLFRYLTLSVDTSDLNSTLSFVKSQWKTLFPGNPFESFFLDTDFDNQYKAEEQMGRIFGIFTVLGLLIACLGLLGLASFSAASRTKEIGIRKVLGSSVSGIVVMLSKQFAKWVVIANVIAWPLAYLVMDRWLRNFAYRTRISIWVFAEAAALSLVIAFLTVSYQSVKAATADPADSLRHE